MNVLRRIFRACVKPPFTHYRKVPSKYFPRKFLECNRQISPTQINFLCTACPEKGVSGCTLNPGRHWYHEDCECAINEQILAELNAAYGYLSMACYFGRSNVAMPGCHGFFIKMHEEELGHAHLLIKYQNMRGGRVKLYPMTCTDCTEWDVKKALECSLEMEKVVKEKLIRVHCAAEKHQDHNMMDMLVTVFIAEQERSICEMNRLLTRFLGLKGCGCAEFLFDKHMHSSFVKKAEKREICELELIYK